MSAEQQNQAQQQDKVSIPVVAHRVRGAEIDRALVTGEQITALCGERWVPTWDQVFNTDPSVDCPLCEHIVDEYLANRG